MGNPGLTVEWLVLSQLSSLGTAVRERIWLQSQIRGTQKAVQIWMSSVFSYGCAMMSGKKYLPCSWGRGCVPYPPSGLWGSGGCYSQLWGCTGLCWSLFVGSCLVCLRESCPAERSKIFLCSLP